MSFNIDYGIVINDYQHHLRGEREYITMVNSKFPLPSPNRECYRILWYIQVSL